LKKNVDHSFDNEIVNEEKEPSEQRSIIGDLNEIATNNNKMPTIINDPFFIESKHRITFQKRTKNDINDDNDDKRFIEHSYFVDTLAKRGKGNRLITNNNRQQRRQTLLPPNNFNKNARLQQKIPAKPINNNGTVKLDNSLTSESSTSLHPSWEASKKVKAQCYIQPSQAKKIVFNNDDDSD